VKENQKLASAQFREANGIPLPVAELHLENIRCQNLDNRSHLSASELMRWPVFKQRDHIKELCRSGLHGDFYNTVWVTRRGNAVPSMLFLLNLKGSQIRSRGLNPLQAGDTPGVRTKCDAPRSGCQSPTRIME